MSKLDPAVFHWHRDGHLHGMIACHVNDFLWAGDDLFTQNVMKNLKCAFDIVKEDRFLQICGSKCFTII